MVAKKGLIMEMGEAGKLLVEDICVVKGVEYIVFYSVTNNMFAIATEEMVNGEPQYNFLDQEQAVKVAKEIDKLKG